MNLRVVATLCLCLLSLNVSAQDEAVKSWDVLVKERETSFARLREIQEQVRTKPPEERQKMADEFVKIQSNLIDVVLPGLSKELPAQLKANPKDQTTLDIANELMRIAYSRNQYQQAKEIADTVLDVDGKNQVAVNVAGVARFALHEFVDSAKMLEAAKANGDLIPELGGQYVDLANKYVGHWAKESAIREKEAAAEGDAMLPRVKFETDKGDIIIELFENEAPNSVANFVSLVESGFYDGLKFHRVIPNFMAQGGCPNSKEGAAGEPGTGGPGYNIKCECYRKDARRHFAGSLSMAHAGKDSGGSQFFITHLPTAHLDIDVGSSVHTVFGRVVEGLDIVNNLQVNDTIIKATVLRKRNHEYKPETIPED